NNWANETTTVNPVPTADLSVVKSDSPDPVIVGTDLTYTIDVTNNGPDPATTVSLTDTLPGSVTFVSASAGCLESAGTVTCDLGSIPNGSTTSITIVVTTGSTGSISNTATASAAEFDPTSANNSDTALTSVICYTITLSPGTLPAGVTGTAYSETVTA